MATTRGRWKIEIGGQVFADYSDMVQRDPVDGGPVVDEQQQAFGDRVVWFERGNFKAARPMTVTKEFASNKEATDFFETAAQDWNGVADVVLTHLDTAGKETRYLLTAAEVRVSAQQPIEVTVVSRVTIVGGPALLQP